MRTSGGYQAPSPRRGMDADEREKVRAAHPNIVELRGLRLPRGRGVFYGDLAPLMNRIPTARGRWLSIVLARFAPAQTRIKG